MPSGESLHISDRPSAAGLPRPKCLTQQHLLDLLPPDIRLESVNQSDMPMFAKNAALMASIEAVLPQIHTQHMLIRGDARNLRDLPVGPAVDLVLTSPPYWTLKQYNEADGQLGHLEDYDEFLDELDAVWQQCYDLLVPGGRLICVVGDVCLSRRESGGRHRVVPLHASIQERCRQIGFDNLAPIIWSKISNAQYETAGGSTFLGKPYEPNAVIKNDIEFILMQRKPGGYRSASLPTRILSLISAQNHKAWFQQIWSGLNGASTRSHPAPYPVELAERLIRMFSFVGDTVLDPFMGTGTTSVAAARCGRSSIGVEVDPDYFRMAVTRFQQDATTLFGAATMDTCECS